MEKIGTIKKRRNVENVNNNGGKRRLENACLEQGKSKMIDLGTTEAIKYRYFK